MTRTLSRLTLVLLAAVLAQAGAYAQDAKKPAKPAAANGNKPYVTVNGSAVPQIRADTLYNQQLSQGVPDSEDLRSAVREEVIRREVLAAEAKKKGLDKNAFVQAQIDLARQAVLISAYMQEYVRSHPVTDEMAKQEYESIKTRLGSKEYKSRHILVEKEDEAKDIIARLQKGEKFEDLAKQSKDPGSKERGGDLGWSAPTAYVKPFADALVKLDKGAFTPQPVRSDFGYHVIKLEDVRDLKVPSFDEAKPQLQQQLQQKLVQQHVKELRDKAKVE